MTLHARARLDALAADDAPAFLSFAQQTKENPAKNTSAGLAEQIKMVAGPATGLICCS
jgi:hypothetical protein